MLGADERAVVKNCCALGPHAVASHVLEPASRRHPLHAEHALIHDLRPLIQPLPGQAKLVLVLMVLEDAEGTLDDALARLPPHLQPIALLGRIGPHVGHIGRDAHVRRHRLVLGKELIWQRILHDIFSSTTASLGRLVRATRYNLPRVLSNPALSIFNPPTTRLFQRRSTSATVRIVRSSISSL